MFAVGPVLAYQIFKSACTDVVSVWSLFSSSSLRKLYVSLGKNAAFSAQKTEQSRSKAVEWHDHYSTENSLGCYCFPFWSKSIWIMPDKHFSWIDTLKEMFDRSLKKIWVTYNPSHLSIALNDGSNPSRILIILALLVTPFA